MGRGGKYHQALKFMKIHDFFKKTHYFWVFLFFFLFFILLQLRLNHFLDPDSYYNVKHSALYAFNNFKPILEPWVKFHFLSYAPADAYFLFHELTAIFIKIFGVIEGSKIFASLGAASFFFTFYLIIHKTNPRKALLFTLILFISSPLFVYRLLQIRAFVPALTLTLLIYYFLNKQKYLLVTLLTIILTLLYNFSIIIIFWALIEFVHELISKKTINLKAILSCLLGFGIGLGLHPQTLNYINIIYTHLITIFSLKIQGISLNSGNEIQYHGLAYFLSNNLIGILIYFFCVFFLLTKYFYEKQHPLKEDFKLFIISLPWFLVAILYPRGTEYWLPFGGLFCVSTISSLSASSIYLKIKSFLLEKLNLKIVKIILLILIGIFSAGNLYSIFWQVDNHNKNDPYNAYKTINEYLIGHTKAATTIYYPLWDMFAQMFYFNTHNTYVSAFDPVFTYLYDPQLWQMMNQFTFPDKICKDQPCKNKQLDTYFNDLPKILHGQLNAEYLVIPQSRLSVLTNYLLNHNEFFLKIMQADDLILFQLQ